MIMQTAKKSPPPPSLRNPRVYYLITPVTALYSESLEPLHIVFV
jgi:hypothetical protein